jgi:hypothetical protein
MVRLMLDIIVGEAIAITGELADPTERPILLIFCLNIFLRRKQLGAHEIMKQRHNRVKHF